MDFKSFVLLLLLFHVRLSFAHPAGSDRAETNTIPSGGLWHVFRQIHASELSSRSYLPSNNSASSGKIVETTRIISEDQPKSQTSFTIISRIQSPTAWLTSKLFQPNSGVMNVVNISGRKTEGVTHDALNTPEESSRPANATTAVTPTDFESERQEKKTTTAKSTSLSPSSDLRGFYTVANGLVRFRNTGKEQQQAESGSGRNRPSTGTIDILWEKPFMQQVKEHSTIKTLDDSVTPHPGSSFLAYGNKKLNNRLVKPSKPTPPQQIKSEEVADRTEVKIESVAEKLLINETGIIELSVTTTTTAPEILKAEERNSNVSAMDMDKPIELEKISSSSVKPVKQTIDEKVSLLQLPHAVKIDNQTVLVPPTSPWATNETFAYTSPNITSSPAISNRTATVEGKLSNRLVYSNRNITSSTGINRTVTIERKPSHSVIQNSLPSVTDVPSSVAEEQMDPPILPVSTSTSTSSSSWLVQYTHPEVNEPISDWQMAEQLMQRPRLQPSTPSSTTKQPVSVTSTTTRPIVNLVIGTAPVQSSTEQSSTATAVVDRPSIRTTPTTPATTQFLPQRDNANNSFILTSQKVDVAPSTPISGGGLTSLIMAHTAALMSGKPSPFGRHSGKPFGTFLVTPTTRKSSTPAVHIIVATALPDPLDDYRYRSLDQSNNTINNINNTSVNSWSFPSFNQLIESSVSLLTDTFGLTSSLLETNDRVDNVSSYNRMAPDPVLPLFPRFTCGQETSTDESVLTNPSFPEPDSSSGHCTFRLRITSNDVCQVRVEFRESRMLRPRQGFCKDQHLTVSGSIIAHPSGVEDRFCGWNSNQHFYLELSEPEGTRRDQRVVEFTIDTQVTDHLYRYSLVLQQIDCRSSAPNPAKAPRGCFQYFYTGRSGVIKSFNYDGGEYWNNQSYRICVRSIDQSCTLTLSSKQNDFGLSRAGTSVDRAGVGAESCPRDYLWIPGSVRSDHNDESNLHDRYCGSKLSDRNGDAQTSPVIVRMYSSIHTMEFRTGIPSGNDTLERRTGFRMTFTQATECPSVVSMPNFIGSTTEGSLEDEISNRLRRLIL